MKVYILAAEVTIYSYADCVDHWYDEPRVLGIYTDKEVAQALADECGAVITEVETDTFLNDCREQECNCCGVCDKPLYACDNCKDTHTILNSSGINLLY